MSNNLGDILSQAYDKVKGMIDTSSVVGTPITTPDGTVLIPITSVSVGVGGGGLDNTSNPQQGKINFSAGSGAGVTISPVAFLVISGGNTKVIYVNQGKSFSTIDKIVDLVPEAIDKIMTYVQPEKGEQEVKAPQGEVNIKDITEEIL